MAENPTHALGGASSITMDQVYDNGSTVNVNASHMVWNLNGTYDFDIQINGTSIFKVDSSTSQVIITSNNVVIHPKTTGTFFDIDLATEFTQGTVIKMSYKSATTLDGALNGIVIDFQANLTPDSNNAVGIDVKAPGTSGDMCLKLDGGSISFPSNDGIYDIGSSDSGTTMERPDAVYVAGSVVVNREAQGRELLNLGGGDLSSKFQGAFHRLDNEGQETTDDTATILNGGITITDGYEFNILAFVDCVAEDGSIRGSWIIHGLAYQTGAGGATLEGQNEISAIKSDVGLDAVLVIDSGGCLIQVTGIAGNDIWWTSYWLYKEQEE